MSGASRLVELRRYDSGTTWGFDVDGGEGSGKPIHVGKVHQSSMAAREGLRKGDVIMRIGHVEVQGMTLEQAKSEIFRAGNDLDLMMIRGGVRMWVPSKQHSQQAHYAQEPQAAQAPPPHHAQQPQAQAEIVEEPVAKFGGPTHKDVQPKTYKILKTELPQSAQGGARPASIFSRKKEDRSKYLNEDHNPFQKIIGEK